MMLGFVGYARSGKNEAANGLLPIPQFSFAAALKREVARMLDSHRIDVDFQNPADKEAWRDFLVYWGRKRRSQQPNYWIQRLIYGINFEKMALGDDLTITDVRYLNECEWILKHRGRLVYLDRPGYEAANDEEAQSIKQILETIPDKLLRVRNDGSIADLHARARACFE